MNKQKGFTLIELVMVIVILGILAAFAVPRFADITTDARTATVNALGGSLRSAAALAHATSLAQSKAAGASISMDGTTVTMTNFYPTSSGSTTEGIVAALADVSGFTITQSITTDTLLFTKTGATTGNCYAAYQAAQSAAVSPTISVHTAGC
ncbi:MAG: type II secretion system protein [Gammaproteobacteria bacterium]|nr:type II secretion system protein [Gammaproteobacteria bacterium]